MRQKTINLRNQGSFDKKIDFFPQTLSHIPRWVRFVQKTRAKNSHAWAPLSACVVYATALVESVILMTLAMVKLTSKVYGLENNTFKWLNNDDIRHGLVVRSTLLCYFLSYNVRQWWAHGTFSSDRFSNLVR